MLPCVAMVFKSGGHQSEFALLEDRLGSSVHPCPPACVYVCAPLWMDTPVSVMQMVKMVLVLTVGMKALGQVSACLLLAAITVDG